MIASLVYVSQFGLDWSVRCMLLSLVSVCQFRQCSSGAELELKLELEWEFKFDCASEFEFEFQIEFKFEFE